MTTTTKTIEIFADTRGRGTCRGPNCRAAITWAETIAGKKMPLTGDPVALSTRHDPATGRLVEAIDYDANHWSTCPDWLVFKTRRG